MINKKQTAQRRAFLKYRSNKCKTYTIVFNKEYDKDIIKTLEKCDNKTDLIRQAILSLKEKGFIVSKNTYEQIKNGVKDFEKGNVRPIEIKEEK